MINVSALLFARFCNLQHNFSCLSKTKRKKIAQNQAVFCSSAVTWSPNSLHAPSAGSHRGDSAPIRRGTGSSKPRDRWAMGWEPRPARLPPPPQRSPRSPLDASHFSRSASIPCYSGCKLRRAGAALQAMCLRDMSNNTNTTTFYRWLEKTNVFTAAKTDRKFIVAVD